MSPIGAKKKYELQYERRHHAMHGKVLKGENVNNEGVSDCNSSLFFIKLINFNINKNERTMKFFSEKYLS